MDVNRVNSGTSHDDYVVLGSLEEVKLSTISPQMRGRSSQLTVAMGIRTNRAPEFGLFRVVVAVEVDAKISKRLP